MIDCKHLMQKLCPSLDLTTNPKRHETAAALLLVTGRRTIEVLSTADFQLGKGQTSAGYQCVFTGQAKTSDGAPYTIPLLAPYSVVRAALTKVRELYPVTGMSSEEVNQAYSTSINHVVKKRVALKPHELRSVYAMATYELAETYTTKKPSLVGWIWQVLGHSNPTQASFYQRVKVINSQLWTGTAVEEEEQHEEQNDDDDDGWTVNGVVERKRLVGIKEMMEHRIPLTATSIRTHAGGTMSVAARIIANNKKKIDSYNASLSDEE